MVFLINFSKIIKQEKKRIKFSKNIKQNEMDFELSPILKRSAVNWVNNVQELKK